MLVKVIDHKGKPRYVNAAFIKTITPKTDTQTEIEISGWAVKIKVDQPAEAVALIVNAALPGNLDSLLAAEDEQQQAAQNAVLIAVIG
jgi:hypothetical protein